MKSGDENRRARDAVRRLTDQRPTNSAGPQRPPGLTEQSFEISVPDDIARAFSYGSSLAGGRALVRCQLTKLCRRLDAWLERPLKVVEADGVRSVTLFGRVRYEVDTINRRVRCGHLRADGTVEYTEAKVRLVNALSTSYWLRWLFEDLSQTLAIQRNLFFKRGDAGACDYWLAQTAYRLLLADPRFKKLRAHHLPRALGLAPSLVALTYHALPPGWAWGICNTTFNAVWQNESAIRQVARENAHLLPLLMLYLDEHELPPDKDPIAVLRDEFREQGLSEAAWRYAVRYGSHLFKVAMRISAWLSLDACIDYLRALDRAGLPPPPAPSLLLAWLRVHGDQRADRVHFHEGWNTRDRSDTAHRHSCFGQEHVLSTPLRVDPRSYQPRYITHAIPGTRRARSLFCRTACHCDR